MTVLLLLQLKHPRRAPHPSAYLIAHGELAGL